MVFMKNEANTRPAASHATSSIDPPRLPSTGAHAPRGPIVTAGSTAVCLPQPAPTALNAPTSLRRIPGSALGDL
jgi:hypothetical protein